MTSHRLYLRHITPRIVEALSDTPVVMVAGARQVGKTTLVRQLSMDRGMRYLTLDDELTRLAALEDPVGLIRNIDFAVIDEVQRAPQLLLAIKKSVDEDRRPGRFLLTGSANLMMLPTVADSLAGRMESRVLWPLAQSEIEGRRSNWVELAFSGRFKSVENPVLGPELVDLVLRGGYPEAVARTTLRRRRTWARQYIDAIIQRDVRELAAIEKLDQLSRLFNVLALTAGQLCNYNRLAGQINLDGKTVARYIGVIEQMYLLKRVDVWSRNRLKRVLKTAKLQFVDSGLLAALVDLSVEEAARDRSRFGMVLESFVFGELLKHIAAADDDYRIMHYRDADQVEVDMIIENRAGDLLAIEVKGAATVTKSDLRGLKKLAQLAGDRFSGGILLYDGHEIMPLGTGLWAVPLSSLWA